MTHLDLFSGIGGFSLAAESVGFKTIGFSEIDPYASSILKKHWPGVPNFGDIRNITGGGIGHVTIITGGFPCQPFSVAGKKLGDTDSRHLWPELCRIVSEVRPKWCLFENVPGLLSNDAGRIFGNVLRDLAQIGYDAIWNCVPASSVGANHQRDRVWIVAHPRHDAGSTEQECKCKASPEKSFGMCQTDVANSMSSKQRRIEWESQAQENVMADTRCQPERNTIHGRHNERSSIYSPGCSEVCDPNGKGLEGQRKVTIRTKSEFGDVGDPSWWSVEPDVGRVANGIPNRVHRLKCLGNSIVPAVAEIFLKEIYKKITR
jgi:DNA (cytosine-5)-methyltransferase 1